MVPRVQQLRRLPAGLTQPFLLLLPSPILPHPALSLLTAQIQSHRTLKALVGKTERSHLRDGGHPPFMAPPSALAEPILSTCPTYLSLLPSIYLPYLPIYPPVFLFIYLLPPRHQSLPPHLPTSYHPLLTIHPRTHPPLLHSLTYSFIHLPTPRIYPSITLFPPSHHIPLTCPSTYPSSMLSIHTHISQACPPGYSCLGGLTFLTLLPHSPSSKSQAPPGVLSTVLFYFLFSAHSCV